jgi:hypothetical protein
MKTLVALTVLSTLPWTAAVAQTCSKQSPDHTVALLELYTSEGCSSCPPADRAVGALQRAANADLVVPLALHVDYWDYIGWKDRFGRADFAQRQRWLAGLAGSRAVAVTVYTPEIFIGGRELRDWSDALPTAIGAINRQRPRADIGIALASIVNGRLPAEIKVRASANARLFVALYETGLSSNVGAGENSGVVLRHDYVVRDWSGPITLAAGAPGGITIARMLGVPSASIPKHLGVAAFVQNDNGEVLQALALPLCGG